jgi:hypothetical protein
MGSSCPLNQIKFLIFETLDAELRGKAVAERRVRVLTEMASCCIYISE